MRMGIMSAAHVHTASYTACLKAAPGVTLLGLADDDAARGRAFAAAHGTRFYDSYAALLAEKPDGVVICSENTRHREMAEMAAQAGAHIMCEKPLATTLADGRAMIQACRDAGVNLMTAFPMRFHPAAVAVKASLDRGEMGAIRCCNCTNQGRNPDNLRPWFTQKALSGGGAAIDHIVHVADLLRWYMGAEVVEVYAEIDNLFYKGEIDVDSAGLVMMTFDNGVFASLDCSWSRPRFYPIWGNVKIDLICARGLLRTDYFIQNLKVYRGDTKQLELQSWASNADQVMVDEFVASIREGRAPAVTGEDGLKAAEVTLAAYRSAETHQPVRLPLA
ncbi:MAG: Gfo/Idh/MocA family oxidoreductase [Anaerolineae bacterium]